MLTLEQIEPQYPENLRPFKRSILREYLQYKVLEIIFNSPYAGKLAFLGGTALRILYGNTRFSEDLDFDNHGLSEADLADLGRLVVSKLSEQGYEVETASSMKNAMRLKIKLPKILFASSLSPHDDEKLMIQIDTLSQDFECVPEKKIINKFDVFTSINVVPIDVILSQKIYAALNRKRAKGRDFYDIVFLLAFAKPNFAYLEQKLGVSDANALRAKILQSISDFDWKQLAHDVRPFLFVPADARKVELFPEFIRQVQL